MVMDPRLRGFSSSMNGIQLGNQPLSMLPNQNLVSGPRCENTFIEQSYSPFLYLQPDQNPSESNASTNSNVTCEDSPEDCDFSDAVLRHISEMLMAEDAEDKTFMPQESLDLQAAERSFYEVLGQKYPPSPEPNLTHVNQRGINLCNSCTSNDSINVSSHSYGNCYLNDGTWIRNPIVNGSFQPQTLSNTSIFQSSSGSLSSLITSANGFVDSPGSGAFQVLDWNNESQSISQFRKGAEEASKFLPSSNDLFFSEGIRETKERTCEAATKLERKDERGVSPGRSRGRKNPHREDGDIEERNIKQLAVFSDSPVRSNMFDKLLLYSAGEGKDELIALSEALKNSSIKNEKNEQSKGSNGGKGRGKKGSRKKEVVDLRTLLISCAQSVASDDRKSANELLKQIRQHSSPFGDGNQRLAHCFANGMEARLAGTGSQIYRGLVSKRASTADYLKAYQLYLAACPFRKLASFVSTRTIMNISENSTKVHLIDFGIFYGIQWPTLIQRLSWRPGGPPKLRITGIDFPRPGFRPAELVEETGRRLEAYAKEFNVPFEYNPIAKKWENIQLEELRIDEDEVVVVTCLYRSQTLLDETVAVDSPRNIVFNLIRKINPNIFIHGIVNGAYNAPFFVTRFREALFHFSAMFDMLETIVPRGNTERMLIEKEIFGREAMNVVACEGWERVERPETYKQWQVRCLRAGFVQLPFDRDIMRQATEKVRRVYHKDFIINEDNNWLLQGWKGRIIFTLSAWKPA